MRCQRDGRSNKIKIALGQMEVKPGFPTDNTDRMLFMINLAKHDKADIIVFPEMAIPGYLLGDMWEREAFLKQCEACGRDIMRAAEDQ